MRILVTGAAGFIGSHLVNALSEANEVIALDSVSKTVVGGDVLRTRGVIKADICSDINRYFEDVDIVYHLAAMSSVRISEKSPDKCFLWNVYGTYNVAKMCVENGVKKVIFSSSREVYGEPKKIPVKELFDFSPKNVYGYSKMLGEKIIEAFCGQSGMNYTIFRIANVYGSGDRGRLIPLLIERLRSGDEFKVFGGEQVFDFVHIDDVCHAMTKYAADNRVLNLGSGIGITMDQVIALVERIAGKQLKKSKVPANPYEVTKFTADISEMRKLGFRPKVEFEGGVRRLYEDSLR